MWKSMAETPTLQHYSCHFFKDFSTFFLKYKINLLYYMAYNITKIQVIKVSSFLTEIVLVY